MEISRERRSIGTETLNYQRGPRGPDPPRYPPSEPCAARSTFGRASLMLSARPLTMVPFNAAMALSAPPWSAISTKAKPRERPVSRSVTRWTRSKAPYGSKRERSESSVVPKSKLPTNIFFTLISLCLRAGYSRRDEISGRVLRDGQTQPNCTSFPMRPIVFGTSGDD
jgi:hypothetical protein